MSYHNQIDAYCRVLKARSLCLAVAYNGSPHEYLIALREVQKVEQELAATDPSVPLPVIEQRIYENSRNDSHVIHHFISEMEAKDLDRKWKEATA